MTNIIFALVSFVGAIVGFIIARSLYKHPTSKFELYMWIYITIQFVCFTGVYLWKALT